MAVELIEDELSGINDGLRFYNDLIVKTTLEVNNYREHMHTLEIKKLELKNTLKTLKGED